MMTHVNVKNLLDIAAALSKEKDYNKLLSKIVSEAMSITGCDGGTLYLKQNGKLVFTIMKTNSLGYDRGADGQQISLPPVPFDRKNVCARAAIDRRVINVPDVWNTEQFDFSGPRTYDAITGYHTQSMLVAPMESYTGEIIGVLQLINAQDENGKIVPFHEVFEGAIVSLASLAAVSISNMSYLQETAELFHSFVYSIIEALDQRTPYNANHTKNMVRYAEQFISYLDHACEQGRASWRFSENDREQFIIAVWLHDVGKIVIPAEIMNKDSRLGHEETAVWHRLHTISLLAKIDFLEHRLNAEQYAARLADIQDAQTFLERVNRAVSLDDADIAGIAGIAARTYRDEAGAERPWLTAREQELLSIRRGTLSGGERQIMNSHVELTSKLLGKIKFTEAYRSVPGWAAKHHELMDGSGYPNRLKGDEVPREVRLLTILDVFDALTASDRPYRPAFPVEQAFSVLDDMVREGKLDGEIVQLFRESRAWEGRDAAD